MATECSTSLRFLLPCLVLVLLLALDFLCFLNENVDGFTPVYELRLTFLALFGLDPRTTGVLATNAASNASHLLRLHKSKNTTRSDNAHSNDWHRQSRGVKYMKLTYLSRHLYRPCRLRPPFRVGMPYRLNQFAMQPCVTRKTRARSV